MEEKRIELEKIVALLEKFNYVQEVANKHPDNITQETKNLVEKIKIFCAFNIDILEGLYTRSIFGKLRKNELEDFDKTVLSKMTAIKSMISEIKMNHKNNNKEKEG